VDILLQRVSVSPETITLRECKMSRFQRIFVASFCPLVLAGIFLSNLAPEHVLSTQMRMVCAGVWISMALIGAYWLFKPAPLDVSAERRSPSTLHLSMTPALTDDRLMTFSVVNADEQLSTPRPLKWSWNKTPSDKLTERILSLPPDYYDEPTSYGDYVQDEMRAAYERAQPKNWVARLLRRFCTNQRDGLWQATLVCQRLHGTRPNREEREAFQQLLEDHARLEYLETTMMDRMVSLTGKPTTRQASATGEAHVHLNGIGYMPFGRSFREAIDNAREASAQPVVLKPLELQPL
jgi:hypothetical protein